MGRTESKESPGEDAGIKDRNSEAEEHGFQVLCVIYTASAFPHSTANRVLLHVP